MCQLLYNSFQDDARVLPDSDWLVSDSGRMTGKTEADRKRLIGCFVNVESVDRIICSIFQRFNLD
jgi:hypothetical protein